MAVPSRHRARLRPLQALRSFTPGPFTTGPVSDRLGDVSERDVGEDFRGGRLIGFFFAGIWLVFLSDAFSAAWQQRQSLRADGGLIVLVVFVVLYLVHFSHLRAAVWGTRGSVDSHWYVTRIGIAYWAGLALLAALATVTIGQEGAATWVFLAVSGLWTFRVRLGLALGGCLVALYEFLTFHVDGWTHDASISMSMVLAMAAVTGGMIAAQRQRALAEAREENARLAIQDERNRMARDVHDILGHSLTVITVKAELAARLLEVSPERARVEVADLERLARDALADVRQAVAGFREMSLPAELARARSSLAAAGIEADLPTAADAVPSHLRELCAWTLREGVTNVIRHSSATTCRVSLDEQGITVTDDGVGVQPGSPGTGLIGLQERAEAAGAHLVAGPLSPRGYQLAVTTSADPRGADPDTHERVEA
ncbi:two-component system, NarL family, sensor histidine kinase DesK [Pedococcus dokdonensis]|uniref:Two-component system, NarL family, sensor histidine kinase DesK n=1 Tax=Pedococcus dokdonensis TaxID=443156 RepID=A0A1H0Q0M5_9MICO|nr:two-component system, NarL family, sensor histidine kinase DesK [Pedococcus dokdonensis]